MSPGAANPIAVPDDEDTRLLVAERGLGRTLFVEAGAGSGKTTALVRRIVNLVRIDGVGLDRIAAITFTEAAAAELSSRVRVALEQALEALDEAAGDGPAGGDQPAGSLASLDPVTDRERLTQALADTDRAAITTLHGFASRLLGEFGLAVGLPPQVHVLDEVSSQLAHEERWDRFVDRLHDDPDQHALLTRAVLVGANLEPAYVGQPSLKGVAVELNDNWDRIESVATSEPAPLTPLDLSAFSAAVAELRAVAATCTDPDDLLHRRIVTELLPAMDEVETIADPGRRLAAMVAGAEAWTTGRGGKRASWPDVDRAKDAVRRVAAVVEEIQSAAADEVLRLLLQLVAREVLDAAQARRDEGGLEFHDLLVLARELLRTSPAARTRLHERYTHLLLDEFQDTDPIQIELAALIAASLEDELTERWEDLAVDEGRLFFVGDPKQSIYRFRRADIELFLTARDRFGPEGGWERLTTNFRTVGPILDLVNGFFGERMGDGHPGQPGYEALGRWRDADSGADHRPAVLGGPHPDPKVKAGELRAAEAHDVATTIADIRDHPHDWPVHDPEAVGPAGAGGGWRPARLADVTVLLPTRTSLRFLRDALDEAGIPYRLATGTLVYDAQEVRDALAVLRAVDDPTDELSLVAALRSPLYGCSDVELFTFRHGGGRWDLRREAPFPPVHVDPADPDVDVESADSAVDSADRSDAPGADRRPGVAVDHPVRIAMAHLRSLWEERWWLTPSALLDRLLRERHAFLLAYGDPRPAEVWRRLRFLVDQARAFEEAGGGSLRSFTDWALRQGADGAGVHEPLLPETDDDAVQILTIHGAKGLEFPITILSGMTTQAAQSRRGVSLLWADDQTPEVRVRSGLATANHDRQADLELVMDSHEKLRLLYVACTRARDHLVVSAHHKTTGRGHDTYAGWLWSYLDAHPDLWRPFPPPPEPAPGEQLTLDLLGDAPEPASRSEERTRLPTADAEGAGSLPDTLDDLPAGIVLDPLPGPEPDDRDGWIDRREAVLAPHRRPHAHSATGIARAALAAAAAAEVPDRDALASADPTPTDLTSATGGPVESAPVESAPAGSDVAGATGATGRPADLDAESDESVDPVDPVDPVEPVDPIDPGEPRDPGDPMAAPEVRVRHQGRVGSAVGRAVHATLQFVDLADPHDLDAHVRRQCDLEAIPDHVAVVAACVRSALASDAVALANAHPHHKELYVAAPVGDGIIEGYVDLLVETPDGLVVIDYKTDSASTAAEVDERLAAYALQGASYAVALTSATGLPVVDCRFVFCRASGPIERSIPDLDAAMTTVRATLGA